MAALLIGGQETGLLDSSFNLLDRNDRTSESEVGNGEQIVVNVASGNLILSKQDTYLPSNGNDYQLTRTYNSRGELSDSGQPDWMSSTSISLEEKREGGETYYEVKYGDGSVFEYRLDAQSGLYVSTDGGGAFETLEDLNAGRRDRYHFEVIRADQSKISFDRRGNMTRWEDPNGVAIEYTYIGEDLRQVQDGTGQRFFYNYTGGRLTSVTDEAGANLVRYGYNSQGRLSQVTDRDGDVTRYAYTSDGNLSRIELPKTRFEAARVITFEYRRVNVVFPDGGPSGSEVLSKMTDAMGNVTTFDYTFAMGVGNVYQGGSTTVTDAQGNRLTYAYDVNGQITAVTDRSGLDTLYGYDADGNLTSVTDRNGEISRFTYDDRGNLLTSTDNSGNSTTYTYTDFNKLESVTTPEGGETLLTYDARQNLIRQVDPGGDITEFEYDALGNQVRQIVYLDSTDLVDVSKQQITQFLYDAFGNIRRTMDATGVVTENSYDQFGNLTSFTDGNGGVTRYTYDGDNRLLTETDPLGNATTNFYDSVGNRISFRDTNGRVTTYIYDRNNRLITTVDGAGPEARTSTRVYDVVGNATSVTDAKGRTTVYNYNARREVIEVVTTEFESAGEPTRYRTLYSYDGEGRVLTVLDNNRNQTTYTYTETGLLETETNARNLQTSYSYDKNLNVTLISIASAIAGPAGRKQEIKYRYDEEDQLLEIEDAEGNKTSYDYDAPGNVVEVIDGNDNAIRYEYDLLNRLVKETLPERDPQSGEFYTVLRSYDANSNEISKTNENGQTTTFAFDADNRRTKITDENGITTEFEYDRKDNLTRVVIGGRENNEAQITTFVYDQFNQLIKEVDAVGHALISSNAELYRNMRGELGAPGNKDNLTVNQQLQLLDLFTTTYTYDQKGMRTSFTDNLGRKTRFEYDGLDRLVLRTDAQGGTQSFRYDGNDNLIWTQDENDNITQFAFDEADQLTRTANAEGGVISYTYDVFGNVIEQTESGNTAVGRSSTYEYDKNNLLKVEINRNAAGPDRTTTYEYDAVGNRTRVTDARNNATQYQYDALNRNIKIIDPLLQEAVFEYDGVGNQVKIIDPRNGETSFAFDPGNRLLSFTDAEGRKTEYVYDVRGNQIQVTTGLDTQAPEASIPQTTTFEYDAENNLRSVVDASGALTRFDFDRVYNEVAVTDARGNTTLSEFDALNREIKVTDPLGNVTRYAYDALGNNVSITDARGFTTGFGYDGNSNLIIERDALGTETHYENDGFGTSVSITRAAVSLELDPITEEPLTAPRKTQFFYDSFGNLERELDALNGEKTYQYDALNNVTEITDEEGRTTVYTYDESSQLTKITDASEQAGETIFGYDANGNRNVVRDAEGRVTTNYYNANDEVVLSIDALGFATAYEYDTNGNVITAIQYATAVALPVDPENAPTPSTTAGADRVTRFEHDALNRLTKKIDPLLGEMNYGYDEVGNQIFISDENDNTTNYAFDELNRLVEIKDALLAGQSEAQRGTQTFAYDAIGNLATETNQNGNTTRYVYDALDRQIDMIDPLGGRMTSTYDAVGNQLTETDERGNTFTFEYDLLNRLIKRTNSELDERGMPGIAIWAYDKVGNRTSLTNEEGEESIFIYDALNQLVRSTDADGNYIKYAFDRVGNEVERRNGGRVAGVDVDDPFATSFVYDDVNQRIERIDAAGGVRTLSYDAFGNLLSEEDEAGNVTRYRYDLNNRLIEAEDPTGAIFGYGYDKVGNKTSETDERLFVTEFTFDALNRLTTQTDPLLASRSVSYDAVGNVIGEKDENDNTAVRVYDANNRLVAFLSADGYLNTFTYDAAGNETSRSEYTRKYTAVAGPDIPHPDDTPRVTTSTYSTLNQLLTSTDDSGLTTFYEYDKAGRLERTFQGVAPVATLRSVVSAASSSAAAVILTPGAGQASITYDSDGRVVQQTDANGVITKFDLDNKGNVLVKTEAFGLADERITTYTYDNLSRLKTETNAIGTVITYDYDASDRLLRRRTSGDANIGTRTERFEYDDAGRLSADVNGVGNRTEYFYDAAGNQIRTEYDVSAPGTAGRFSKLFEYDGNNRLIEETDGEGVRTRYEYDANGNKTQTIQAYQHPTEPQRVTTYFYDAENRLTSITNPEGKTTAYEYDVDGNRSRIVDARGTVTENTFDTLGRILTNTVDAGGANGGVRTTNTYDSRGNLLSTSVGFADGSDTARVIHYEYDALDQLIKLTDPEGFATLFTFDSFGNQTSVTLGVYEGETETESGIDKAARAKPQATYFFYDAVGRLERTIDGEGNAVELGYDAHGNQILQTTGIKITAAEAAANTDLTASDDRELTSVTRYSYDLNGELLEKETQEGGRVVIVRDRLGRQTRVQTLQSSGPDVWVVETFDYDSMGRVIRSTDSYDVVTTFDYDALGNLVTLVNAAGTETRALGTADRVSVSTYDLNSNLKTFTDAEGNTTRFFYDDVGNLARSVDANGGTTLNYFNERNQLVGTVDTDNVYTLFVKDSSGNNISQTVFANRVVAIEGTPPTPVPDSVNDRVVTQTFNGNNKRVSETFPNGSVKNYEFDSAGRLLSLTEDVSAVSDAAALARTTDSSAKVLAWEYDRSGRLVKFINVNDVVEEYRYDSSGNKIEERTIPATGTTAMANGAVDPVRVTTFTFDSSNRLLTQSTGTNTQTLEYDLAGNVLSKTDALGQRTTTTYDRNNRIAAVTDALGQQIEYVYDAVGNLVETTDARGLVYSVEYDRNNRATSESTPGTTFFNLDSTDFSIDPATIPTTSGRATVVKQYDDVGNLVRTTDESGRVTTRWFDSSNRVIAEIDGNQVLRKYSYNAFGELLSITLDKQFAGNVEPTAPVPVAVAPTVISNSYDTMGNLVLTTYPEIAVTTLNADGTARASTTDLAPTEQSLFDAFGNLVESIDRRGNSAYSFVNRTGLQVALVDADGFMIQSEYDSLGNLIQQRKYREAVSVSSPGQVPSGGGAPDTVDRVYDVEGRLTQEISAGVKTGVDGSTATTRVTTSFVYDVAGNLKQRTLASGTDQAQSEYYFYDAIGQRTGVVNGNGILATFDFDENGNLTQQARYITPVSSSIDLASVATTTVTLEAGVAKVAAKDQSTNYTYNHVNLLSTQTNVMGAPGGSDDIVTRFNYDQSGNMTRRVDGEGFVSYLDYDANGNITLTISPNGSRSFVEYNTSGLKTRAWTGGIAATSPDNVTGIVASLANGAASGIEIEWTPAESATSSWVTWDTQSLVASESAYGPGNPPSAASNVGGDGNEGRYRNATEAGITGVTIPLDAVAAGKTVYFRVVTNNNGNLSWSDERAVFVPARIDSLSVDQQGEDFTVTVGFDGAVTDPGISYGSPVTTTALSNVAGNTYTVTLSGVSNPQDLLLAFTWDSEGEELSSTAATLLVAPGDHANQGNGFFSWPLPNGGGAPFDGPNAGELLILNGVSEFDRGTDFGGAAGVVFPSTVDSSRVGGTVQINPPPTGTVNYDLYYGERVTEGHSLDVRFTDIQEYSVVAGSFNTVPGPGDPPTPPTINVSRNYTTTWASDDNNQVRAEITVELTAAENSRVDGDVMLAYRVAGSDGEFANSVAMTKTGQTWAVGRELNESTSYDLKLFYLESDGTEVIVEWRRITTPAESAPESATVVVPVGDDPPAGQGPRTVDVGIPFDFTQEFSFRVLGAERGSTVSGSGAARSIEVGTYTGPLDPSALGVNLTPVESAGTASFLPANYQDIYFTEIVYNDLGVKIGSNEDTGVWRSYGVDAAGNQVMTGLYGTRALADADGNSFSSSRNSYAQFNNRNNETKTVGVAVGGQAAVTETVYDYAGQVASRREPGATIARRFEYDGVGNLISETDSLGNPTLYTYDLLGNRVRSSRLHDDRGSASDLYHTEIFVYSYTRGINANRMTSSYFAGKQNEKVDYTYDGFGRRLSMTNGKGEATTVAYDQRGRVTRLTDAMGEDTFYSYDKRGNQTWVQDAEDNFFGRAYNSMGLLTHEYAFTSAPADLARAQALAAAGTDASLVVKTTVYDIWNNKIRTIDAQGRSQSFSYFGFGRVSRAGDSTYSYDVWGRQISETNRFGKSISRVYDAAGRLTRVNDTATNTYTFYQYDSAGRRTFERLRKGGNSSANDFRVKTYTYDDKGQLRSWRDSRSGLGATYAYFNDGNVKSITENVPGTDPVTTYTFDRAGRVLTAGNETFSYDNAGRRATSTVGGTTTTYTYNANGWVTAATGGNAWSYDKVGNVTRVTDGDEVTTNTYDDRYLVTFSNNDGQTTRTTFDKSGRTLRTVVVDDGNTFTYNYSYIAEGELNGGLQRAVEGSGSEVQTSSSSSSYDVNGNLIRVGLGQGDEDDRAEVNTFRYDNDGNIIEANRLPGTGSREISQYLYANGDPVGDYVSTSDARINEGPYSTVINIDTGLGEDAIAFPGASIIQHTVAAGETLRSLADRYYGSPDLWYVIADANGLTGREALKVGSRLVVPNTVANEFQNADTHALYKESSIIGSQLPNLASPPPPEEDNCAVIAAIILIVVVAIVAVVVTVVTVGAAAPAAAAALGLTAGSVGAILVGVAVGAVIGAAIAFAASVVTQGILIGFGLQEGFDWEAVAADTVAGAFGGAAAGLGAAASAASRATRLLKVVNVIGQATLEASGEAASQAIQNDGKIDNPWLVVAAGAGGAFGAIGDTGSRTAKAAAAVDDTTRAARKASKATFETVDEVADASRTAGAVAKRFDKDVFSAVFKAEWSKSVRPIAGLVAGGKKLASAGAALVSAPFKALRAGGEAVAAGGRAFARGFGDVSSDLGRLARVKGGFSELSAVARRGASSAASGVGESLGNAFAAVKRAPQSFSEFRSQQRIINNLEDVTRAGTVAKTDLTKTVRFFDEIDGQKITRYKTVVRNSAKTAGKTETTKFIRGINSITELPDGARKISFTLTEVARLSTATPSKFKRFAIASKNAVSDGVRSAAQATFNVVKKPFVAIKEFARKGTVAKLETTKLVRSFDTVDGKRIEKLTEVVRDSRRTGIKTANFKTQRILDASAEAGRLGQTRMIVVARKNPAGTSKLSRYIGKPLSNAAASVKKSVAEASNSGSLAKRVGFVGRKASTAVPVFAGEGRDDSIRRNPGRYFSTAGSGGRVSYGKLLSVGVGRFGNSKFGFLARGPLAGSAQWLDTAVTSMGLPNPDLTQKAADAQPFADAFRTRPAPPPLDDRNGLTTYADLHARQNSWIPVDWVSVAAGTTTQVFSPNPIDRSAGLSSVLASNRMVSGEVGDFEQSQVVAFSERSVGGVGGDISRTPSAV